MPVKQTDGFIWYLRGGRMSLLQHYTWNYFCPSSPHTTPTHTPTHNKHTPFPTRPAVFRFLYKPMLMQPFALAGGFIATNNPLALLSLRPFMSQSLARPSSMPLLLHHRRRLPPKIMMTMTASPTFSVCTANFNLAPLSPIRSAALDARLPESTHWIF